MGGTTPDLLPVDLTPHLITCFLVYKSQRLAREIQIVFLRHGGGPLVSF